MPDLIENINGGCYDKKEKNPALTGERVREIEQDAGSEFFRANTLPAKRLNSMLYTHLPPRVLYDESKQRSRLAYAPVGLRVIAGDLHVIGCGQRRIALRSSLSIALSIARKRVAVRSQVRDRVGMGVADDGAIVAPVPETVRPRVLYLNTLVGQRELENEMLGLMPELDLWTAAPNGPSPLADIPLDIIQLDPSELLAHIAPLRNYVFRNAVNVIVLNSFEFACMVREREKLVFALKTLRDTFGVTVLIYSHECATATNEGSSVSALAGRSAMRLLGMIASSVVQVRESFVERIAEEAVAESEAVAPVELATEHDLERPGNEIESRVMSIEAFCNLIHTGERIGSAAIPGEEWDMDEEGELEITN